MGICSCDCNCPRKHYLTNLFGLCRMCEFNVHLFAKGGDVDE